MDNLPFGRCKKAAKRLQKAPPSIERAGLFGWTAAAAELAWQPGVCGDGGGIDGLGGCAGWAADLPISDLPISDLPISDLPI
ncbi:MAG: hypothetical protein ACTTJV_02865, partial [Ottowia sp.]